MALPISGAIRVTQLEPARSTELCPDCGLALVLLGVVVEAGADLTSHGRAVCVACSPSTG